MPLFEARWERELAVALAAELLPLGQIDGDRLVRQAARGLPLATIPRRGRWSVSRGLQLLVDFGCGGEPFRQDQARFARVLQAVLGRDRVELAGFHGCPSRGVIDDVIGERAYRPPPAGVPVLVLGDLGFGPGARFGGGATPSEWTGFARALRRQGSRLVALTTERQFPTGIRDVVTVIPWRRTTTQQTVREALARS